MKGWIIYDEIGFKRNKWFIDEFIKESKLRGIDLKLVISTITNFESLTQFPDFVIIRTINPSLNKFFEEKRITTFNNYITSFIANDKWQSYRLCKKLSIPVMDTNLIQNDVSCNMSYPFVLKSLDGHGGSEVFRINDEKEYLKIVKCLKREKYIIQKFCSDPGKDMRVYVMNGEIICSILRESKFDFRSNYSLGGTVKVVDIEQYQLQQIEMINTKLNCFFVGMDFIFHNGRWVLNEIEDIVGCRMLYECTRLNIVSMYLDKIIDVL